MRKIVGFNVLSCQVMYSFVFLGSLLPAVSIESIFENFENTMEYSEHQFDPNNIDESHSDKNSKFDSK